jgi:DNA-directed RNA polymerase subunit L
VEEVNVARLQTVRGEFNLKLNIIKQEDERLEIEFGGEGDTLLNIIQSSLLENPDVKMAGYSKPHPLMNRSRLFIMMNQEKDPQNALLKASNDAKNHLKRFLNAFEKGN